MIVRLSRGNLNRVEDACEGDPFLLGMLRRDITYPEIGAGEGIAITVNAPYLLWVKLRDRLMKVAYTKTGGKARGGSFNIVSVVRQITTATNTHERHAALRGAAMLGTHFEWFYVWRMPEADSAGRIWSPTPVPGKFAVLAPRWTVTKHMQITEWSTHGAHHSVDDLFSESVHIDIWRS